MITLFLSHQILVSSFSPNTCQISNILDANNNRLINELFVCLYYCHKIIFGIRRTNSGYKISWVYGLFDCQWLSLWLPPSMSNEIGLKDPYTEWVSGGLCKLWALVIEKGLDSHCRLKVYPTESKWKPVLTRVTLVKSVQHLSRAIGALERWRAANVAPNVDSPAIHHIISIFERP